MADRDAAVNVVKSRSVPPVTVIAVVLGLLALSSAALTSRFALAGALIGFAALFLLTSSLSHAGRIARAARPLIGRPVAVEAWGLALPGMDGEALRLDSVVSVGAGLLLYLLAGDRRRVLVKVAQPRDDAVTASGLRIGRAAYVSWAGRRLPRAPSAAPALVLAAVGSRMMAREISRGGPSCPGI